MPTISILTSAYAPSAQYLRDTINAVKLLQLPDGWSLQWVVQEDGPSPSLQAHFEGLDFVSYQANFQQLGLPFTRNLALSRVEGELVQLLDHDDILLPHSLSTMIERFLTHEVHWAIGQADDLMPDGQRIAFPPALPFGVLQPGVVNDWAVSQGGNWPLHCAGLTIRTNVLRAVGGWAALPVDDDLGMFTLLSEVAAGYHEETVTWLYRQHPEQTHKKEAWRRWADTGRAIALQRVFALREARLNLDPATPTDFGRPANPVVPVGPLHPDKLRHGQL